MRVYHPNAVRDTTDPVDGYVDVDGDLRRVDGEDTLEVSEGEARALAGRYGLELDDIRVDDEGDDEDVVTCAGKGGECSREVDEPGDLCWQHSE